MSPEQMQSMMAGMRGMDPSMMSAAMGQMKNMSSTDWENARRQVRSRLHGPAASLAVGLGHEWVCAGP